MSVALFGMRLIPGY